MIIWSLEVVGVKNHIMAQIFLGRASEIKSFWDLIIGTGAGDHPLLAILTKNPRQ